MATSIDNFDREIALTRRNQKLMAHLDECARQTELIPLNEVKRRLGLVKGAARDGKSNRKNGSR